MLLGPFSNSLFSTGQNQKGTTIGAVEDAHRRGVQQSPSELGDSLP